MHHFRKICNSNHFAPLMAHTFVELNKEMHGRICAHGMNALLHYNRDDTIARQEKEILTLKRKLEEMTRDKNDMSTRRNEMSTRLIHARLRMRENFDAVRDYMLGASEAKGGHGMMDQPTGEIPTTASRISSTL